MNTFTAILAFATICAIPMCHAVPCLSSPVSVISNPGLIGASNLPLLGGWDWSSCLSPATNYALNGGYWSGLSGLSGLGYLPGTIPCDDYHSSLISGPVAVESVVTHPSLVKKPC